MARERSDKSKNKSSKEDKRVGKSDEGLPTRADPAERTMSRNPAQRNPLQSTAGSKKRQERQQVAQETSADSRKSEKVSEQTISTASTNNGHQGIEEDAAHYRIAERAFILFQERGCEHGNDWAHWFEAERQIKDTQRESKTVFLSTKGGGRNDA